MFQVLLGWMFGIVGVLFAACLVLVPVIFTMRGVSYSSVNFVKFKKLLKYIQPALNVALPLIAFTMLKYADVWLSGWNLGVKWSGYLGIYITFTGLVALPASIISTYFFTSFAREFRGSVSYTLKISAVNCLISFPTAYIGIKLFELLTINYLHDYLPASHLLNSVWWSIPLLTLRNIVTNFLFANRIYLLELCVVISIVILKFVLWNFLEVADVLIISNVVYCLATVITLVFAVKIINRRVMQ